MEEDPKLQFVGSPCGKHGSYIFYKAFRYFKEGQTKILSPGEFFFLKLLRDGPLCIGEIQLLWQDVHKQNLSSLRLYFLPKDTPIGELPSHGQDEVFALSEKLVLRLQDLVKLIVHNVNWTFGSPGVCEDDVLSGLESVKMLQKELPDANHSIKFNEIKKERKFYDIKPLGTEVKIVSFSVYCRYRAVSRRCENVKEKFFKNVFVAACGGIMMKTRNGRIMFCRETFNDPDLANLDICRDYLAPNLKGRPRKKKKLKKGASLSSDSNEDSPGETMLVRHKANGNKLREPRHEQLNGYSKHDSILTNEKLFLESLHNFMRKRTTPIERIPSLGFKMIDLFAFYKNAYKLGGYERITNQRMWKQLYDMMGGNPGSTSAATCTRRHYERLLLPFELSQKGKDLNTLSDIKQKKSSHVSKLDTHHSKQLLHRSNEDKKDKVRRFKSGTQPTVKKLLCEKYNQDPSDVLPSSVKREPSDTKPSEESLSLSASPSTHVKKGPSVTRISPEVKNPVIPVVKLESPINDWKLNACLAIPKEITAAAVLASQSPSPIQLGLDKKQSVNYVEKSQVVTLPSPSPPSNPSYERISPVDPVSYEPDNYSVKPEVSPCSDVSDNNDCDNQIKTRPGPSILGPLLHKQKRGPAFQNHHIPSSGVATVSNDSSSSSKCIESTPPCKVQLTSKVNTKTSATSVAPAISSRSSTACHSVPVNRIPENGRWHVPKVAHTQPPRTHRNEELKSRTVRQTVIQPTPQSPPNHLLSLASPLTKYSRPRLEDSLPQPAHTNHMKRARTYSNCSYNLMSPITAHISKTSSNNMVYSTVHSMDTNSPYYIPPPPPPKRQKLSSSHTSSYLDTVHRPNDIQSEPTDLSMKTLKKVVNGRMSYKNSSKDYSRNDINDSMPSMSFGSSSSPTRDLQTPLDMTTSSKKYNVKVSGNMSSNKNSSSPSELNASALSSSNSYLAGLNLPAQSVHPAFPQPLQPAHLMRGGMISSTHMQRMLEVQRFPPPIPQQQQPQQQQQPPPPPPPSLPPAHPTHRLDYRPPKDFYSLPSSLILSHPPPPPPPPPAFPPFYQNRQNLKHFVHPK
ncbi:AT-rich interactive domain-containing protein 5B [Octopus vulgaris]|uniref:AT-rich interactive domain-containing protein 5B n=1 Tax=Octopus vulgaris TaxID=6645 RepID=A0AA36ANF8_OCTVU|nr:AT-rich interactive domain-containing protein 5B [Octopus vulgaris]